MSPNDYSASERRVMRREQNIATGITLLAAIGIVALLAAGVLWVTGILH